MLLDIENLKEWEPLENLLNQIPVKVGLLKNLNLTCLASNNEFLAIGTDCGIVLWYNRIKKQLQKLRTESASAFISCVSIINSVEYMVACGTKTGAVTIFQIEKEHPPDLGILLPKPKPIERYTVTVHKHTVNSVAWSKNGMKLFSGDSSGLIAMTEIDYTTHTSRSREIINESYEIIQLQVHQTYLLASSTFRSIICHKEQDDSWKVLQIGKKDRKALCKLGATTLGSKQNLLIISTRPGYRFWLSDINGNVTQTLVLKDELVNKQFTYVPLLNPSKYPMAWVPLNFGLVYSFGEEHIITWGDNTVYIINLKTLKIEKVIGYLRGIIDIAVAFPEIFILETARSIIRISHEPEYLYPIEKTVLTNYPLWTNTNDSPEDKVDSAEECLDLTPIISFFPDGPAVDLEQAHERLYKKFEQLSQIDVTTENDDPILFESRGRRRKSDERRKSTVKRLPNNAFITERVVNLEENKTDSIKINGNLDASETLSTFMDISCYNHLEEPSKEDREIKERELAEKLNIEPIALEPIESSNTKLTDTILSWSYPAPEGISLPKTTENHSKIHPNHNFTFQDFITSVSDDAKLEKNLSDDMKNIMIRSEIHQKTEDLSSDVKENVPKNSMSKSMYDKPSPDVAILNIADYMNIPSLWNKMERIEDESAQNNDELDDITSEWEIV